MIILGISAYHFDSSACLLINGKLVGAISEERLGRRIKHDSSFPINAIKFLLESNNISIENVDYVAVGQDKSKNLLAKINYSLTDIKNSYPAFLNSAKKLSKVNSIKDELKDLIIDKKKKIKFKVTRVEHHLAHTASSYLLSSFKGKSASLSFDGSGDFVSMMLSECKNNKIKILKKIYLPHSVGFFYTAIAQFLGFHNYGDEYKVMGLAAYGQDNNNYDMSKIIKLDDKGFYKINKKFIKMHSTGSAEKIFKSNVVIEKWFKPEIEQLLGKSRKPNTKIKQSHMDIAKAVQAHFEKISIECIKKLSKLVKTKNLCLSGGCALNGLLAGKIAKKTKFKNIYIPPASSDDGLSVGAAFYLWNNILNKKRTQPMKHAYWGPQYNNNQILKIIKKNKLSYKLINNDNEICKRVSKLIASGNVIGWFQGREELGQRALGNRSILANPVIKSMKNIVNTKIKKRESFRPFAPSVLEEDMNIFFEEKLKSPFMNFVLNVKKKWINKIPAVVNIDGTARAHSVSKKSNKLFYTLLTEFKKVSGIGMLLNTSFNENEPIVSHPQQAIDCFLRTDLDYLCMGNFLVKK
tara:strand:+ start:104 stop:1840 length:1737 start_codon:yes stop_codon:yes gene_type:complete